MARAVIAVFAIVILAFLGVTMFQASLADAGPRTTITNESFNANQTGFITLNESNKDEVIYGRHPTVRNGSDEIMNKGTNDDYLWNQSDATIDPTASGNLQGDNNSTITYSFTRVTEEQKRLTELLSIIPGNIGLILVALFAVLFLVFLT